MSEAKQMLFARNLISICVDSNDNADFQGKIWHQYSDDPIEFGCVTGLLTIVDGLMDEWDFPQKSLEQREFGSKKEHPRHKRDVVVDDELVIDKVQQRHGIRNIQGKSGKLGTFVVQIAYRQNATWQGQVVIVESNSKESFSSAMELIKIMSNSLKGE